MPTSRKMINISGVLLIVWVLYWGPVASSHTDSTAAPAFIAARTFTLVPAGNNSPGNPRSVALGDFNGDGKPDIAVANNSSPTVSVVLANGDGTFGAATRFSVGSFPRFVLARDLNEDGTLDLAVANSNSASVSILLGNGLGGFGPAANFSVGTSPHSLAVADFNGDGHVDLVAGNAGSNNISLLIGNGGGGFSSPTNFAVGLDPLSIASGDFNGDSKPDLAVVNFNAASVQVLLNNSAGGFAAPVTIAVGVSPSYVLVTDLNNDAKSDLVVANSGSDNVSVLMGNGTGSFASPVNFATHSRPFCIASADLNGDGKLDLAVANSNSSDFSILAGDGSGSFGSATNVVAGPIPQSLAISDFNVDGRADVVIVNSNSPYVWIFAGKGAGNFVTAPGFPSGSLPSAVVVSDFNADGKADVATSNAGSNDVSVLLGNGSGALAAAANFPVGTSPRSLAVADFNADNKIDLLVGKTSPNELCVLLGNGAGSFGGATNFSVVGEPLAVASGDFNGDGKADAVAAANGTGINPPSISVLFGNGAGGFSAPVQLSTSDASSNIAVGDFNADGKSDMAVATGSRVAVFLGSGTASFGPPTLYLMMSNDGTPSQITNLVVGDLDGDGKSDLAVSIALNLSVLLGKGDGTFNAPTNFDPAGKVTTIGDFNGDGRIDLGLTNGIVSVVTNIGAGAFGSRVDYGAGPVAIAVAAGDFNSDGKLDLVTADQSATVFVLLNADTSPGVQLSSPSYVANEGDGLATITVTRSGDASGASTVEYTTSDNAGANNCNVVSPAASSRCDYETTAGVLRFAAGETARTISIPIIDDSYAEGGETFAITLSNATGASLGSPSTATIAISDNENVNGPNPIDQANFFVRQHYLDFLNREPDASGLAFWTDQIASCGSDQACIEVKRINVSAAFFLSIEFQETGYLVYRVYKIAYGNLAGAPVPVRLSEFLADSRQVGEGVVVGQSGWEQTLENNKQAFAAEFVLRSRFTAAYATSLTPGQLVDALYANAGVTPAPTERTAAINEFGLATDTAETAARARVLRRIAENSTLAHQESNKAFVLMQYFGYLRRNPNDAPEPGLNFDGYDFWLNKLNQFNGNFVNAEMVKAFITSGEYRQRFGP